MLSGCQVVIRFYNAYRMLRRGGWMDHNGSSKTIVRVQTDLADRTVVVHVLARLFR